MKPPQPGALQVYQGDDYTVTIQFTAAGDPLDVSSSEFIATIASGLPSTIDMTDAATGIVKLSLAGTDTATVAITTRTGIKPIDFDIAEVGHWDRTIIRSQFLLNAQVVGTPSTAGPGAGMATGLGDTIAVTVADDGGDILTVELVEFVDKAIAIAIANTYTDGKVTTEAHARADGDEETLENARAYTDERFESIAAGVTLPPAKAAATGDYGASYPFSGLPPSSDTDGVTLNTGDVLLLPDQSAASRSGPWVVDAGLWSRPSWFTGAIPSGKTIEVLAGATLALTTFEVTGTGTIDTNVQTWEQLHGQLLTSDTGVVKRNAAAKITAAVSALGMKLRGFDFYDRDDCSLARLNLGEHMPSGHRYTSDGDWSTNSEALIVDGQQVWGDETTPGATPIRILGAYDSIRPRTIMKAPVFIPGTTDSCDSVAGTAAEAFAHSSIQFALSADAQTVDLFYTELPGAGIVSLLGGAQPLPDGLVVADSVTPYFQVMRWDPIESSIRAYVDGVLVAAAAAPQVNAYWGRRVCSQMRKQLATDGIVRNEFFGWAA